jgi:hypothetical protein
MKMQTAAPLHAPQIPRMPKINFRIERLTLENYSRADQIRFTRTLEKRLRNYALTARLDWSAVKSTGRIDVGTLPAGTTPEQAARQVAWQIVMGLREEESFHA